MSFASPDPSRDDRTPGPYQVWNVLVAFSADRGGDSAGIQRVQMEWENVPAGSRERALLVELWELWTAQRLAQMRADGVPDVGFW